MAFAYLQKNRHMVRRWVDELVALAKAEDKEKLALKRILHQRLWVSPMLNGKEVLVAFRAACKKLAKHRSITRLRLEGALLAALKQFQKVPLPRNPGSAKQSLQAQE